MNNRLTSKETAQRLGICDKTLRLWVKSGKLTPAKGTRGQGRAAAFARSHVDALVDNTLEVETLARVRWGWEGMRKATPANCTTRLLWQRCGGVNVSYMSYWFSRYFRNAARTRPSALPPFTKEERQRGIPAELMTWAGKLGPALNRRELLFVAALLVADLRSRFLDLNASEENLWLAFWRYKDDQEEQLEQMDIHSEQERIKEQLGEHDVAWLAMQQGDVQCFHAMWKKTNPMCQSYETARSLCFKVKAASKELLPSKRAIARILGVQAETARRLWNRLYRKPVIRETVALMGWHYGEKASKIGRRKKAVDKWSRVFCPNIKPPPASRPGARCARPPRTHGRWWRL